MLGLMKKDLITAKKQLIIVAAIMILYVLIMGMGKSADWLSGMFGGYSVAIMSVVPITMVAYDEKNKWGRYSSAMPISRRTCVVSRFLLMLVMTVVIVGAYMLFSALNGIEGAVYSMTVIASLCVIMSSVILTVAYRFGSDKARYIFMAAIFIIVFALSFIVKDSAATDEAAAAISGTVENLLTAGTAAVAILVYIACMAMSVRIYARKDL